MNDNSRVRVHIVGVVVTALFCSLLARLWFLQVRENATEVSISSQATRTIRTPSSRGLVYDSEGRLLVGNRVAWAVTADPVIRAAAHDSKDRAIVPKLAGLLGSDVATLTRQLDARRVGPLESVVLASSVSPALRTELTERADEFPHIALAALELRWYADPSVAPQVLGYLGRVTEQDIARHTDYGNNELIGRTGIEAVYESMLRGTPSSVDVAVDGRGQIAGDPLHVDPGRPGYNVNLTIDGDLQKFAQGALEEGIAMARTERNEDFSDFNVPYRATGGAVVVLDTTDGSVKALASSPGYDNSNDLGAQFDELTSKERNQPLLNRATRGLYAPGSTFKLVSAIASVQTGTYGEFTPVDQGDGCYRRGTQFKVCSPGSGGGTVDLRSALTESSDVYFYSVGDSLWNRWRNGDVQAGYAIQNTAKAFGFGSKTGIDAGEATGRVPDEAWKRDFAKAIYKDDRRCHPKVTAACPEDANNDWNPGDNISLAVGQGDLVVTPLQLANAYAALANGGTVWRPRLVNEIVDSAGKPVPNAAIAPKAKSKVVFDDQLRSALMDGFRGVVTDKSGTARQAFAGFPIDQIGVWGKTGTAQTGPSKKTCMDLTAPDPFKKCIGDTSWFVSMFAPAGTDQAHPRYVVLAMVEEGGRGGRIAAPIARQVIEHMNNLPITKIPQLTAGAVAGNTKG